MKLFYVSTYNDSFSHILKTLSTINKTRETSNFFYRSNSHLAADTQCGLASSLKAFQHLALTNQRAESFITSYETRALNLPKSLIVSIFVGCFCHGAHAAYIFDN